MTTLDEASVEAVQIRASREVGADRARTELDGRLRSALVDIGLAQAVGPTIREPRALGRGESPTRGVVVEKAEQEAHFSVNSLIGPQQLVFRTTL